MADYKVVYRASDAEIPWEPGCPVALTAVQVSRNTETSEAWLQAKARNVSAASVASVYADLRVEYADGAAEEMPVEYLDADIDAGAELALKPRRLPRGDVASCALTIKRVDAGDVTWASAGGPEPMPKRETLPLSPRAAEQRARNLGTDKASPAATGKVRDHGGWWVCACGQVNVGRDSCWSCAFPKNGLLANEDEAALLADADKYEKELFDKAVELQSQGTVASLTEAIDKFNSLGNYQDAAERLATSSKMLGEMKKKRNKKISIALSTVAIAAIAASIVVPQVVIPAREKAAVNSVMQTIASSQIGETVQFGEYEQDNDESNGKEPITWRILAIEDDKALLITEKALDCKPYYSKSFVGEDYTVYGRINYSRSDLCAWLSNKFTPTAFPKNAEQDAICTEPFCLTEDEARNYFTSNEDRICEPTEYAKAQGVEEIESSCAWWLSSPVPSEWEITWYYKKIVYISAGCVQAETGAIGNNDLSSKTVAVRPAIWVQL